MSVSSRILTVLLLLVLSKLYSQSDFVFSYRIDQSGMAVQFPKPVTSIDYTVDWGDGSPVDTYTPNQRPSHIFESAGDKTITYNGEFTQLSFERFVTTQDMDLIRIIEWGDHAWVTLESMFRNCVLLESLPSDHAPNLSECTSMANMFQGAVLFNSNINDWNVSNVTNMSALFNGAVSFNQPLNDWDVSNVTNMSSLFYGAVSFNQPLNEWDVSSVSDMMSMFTAANNFNQPLNNWNVSSVINMAGMFQNTEVFNQELGEWDVSSVTDMSFMFSGAQSFNKPINTWNVSSVLDMYGMFSGNGAFNLSLNGWDVSNVLDMSQMFVWNPTFNGDLSEWRPSSVTKMSWMFWLATSFNQDIGDWDVSSVNSMFYMFNGATSFNQDISDWDVSSVIQFDGFLEGAVLFDQDLSSWDVSSAQQMGSMFRNTKSNYDLSSWDTSSVVSMAYMFSGTPYDHSLAMWDVSKVEYMDGMLNVVLEDGTFGISQENYEDTLIGWASQNLQNSVVLGAGDSQYCEGEEARDILTDTFGWTISDGGKIDNCNSLSDAEYEKDLITVYPNPTTNFIKVQGLKQPTKYAIYNAFGVNIDLGTVHNKGIDVSGYSSGVYLLKLDKRNVIKFIII